jgi:hypothetical protein
LNLFGPILRAGGACVLSFCHKMHKKNISKILIEPGTYLNPTPGKIELNRQQG